MQPTDVVIFASLTVWFVLVVVTSRKVLRRMAASSQDAWSLSMRWGFLAGLGLALALSSPAIFLWLTGRPADAAGNPILLFIIIGFASGPGLAFYLYRSR